MLKRTFLCAALMMTIGLPVHAGVIVSHQGNTDPTTEGFTRSEDVIGTGAPTLNDGPQAIGPSWEIEVVNTNSTNRGLLRFIDGVSAADQAEGQANGWTLRAEIQAVDDAPVDFGVTLEYRLDLPSVDHRWMIKFGLDNGVPQLEIVSNSGIVSLPSVSPGEFYLTELVYDPNTAKAELFVNGTSVKQNLVPNVRTQNDLSASVLWGTASTGHTGTGYYKTVELEVVPEPASIVLTVLGFLGSVVFFRRSKASK